MTPNILEGMKNRFTSGKPHEYVWFDLGDFTHMTDEETQQLSHIPRMFVDLPDDMLMPFDRMAFVRTSSMLDAEHSPSTLTTTIERDEDGFHGVLRGRTGDIAQLHLSHDRDLSFWLNDGIKDPMDIYRKLAALGQAPDDVTPESVKERLAMVWCTTIEQQYLEFMRRSLIVKRIPLCFLATPNSTNERRVRKGKQPLFEWKVIEVDAKYGDGDRTGTGTHASPRLHMRRGHERICQSGKRVWVRSTMVGKIEFGYIHHSYTTNGGAHATL